MKRLSHPIVAVLVAAFALTLPTFAQQADQAVDARLDAIEERLAKIDQLEQRLRNLEAQIQRLAQQAAAPQARQAPQGPSPQKEQAAIRLLDETLNHIAAGEIESAREKLAQIGTEYGDTRAARSAASINAELAVIGKEAPADYGIEKWFSGQQEVDLASGKPTLLVFWELWCPHCRREVPKVQELYAQYKDEGLQVVGLTKLSRNTTEEAVTGFLEQQNVSYPTAKESGDASAYFSVRGVPAAAVVKDGKVIWRGHPARITPEMVQGWL